MLLVSLAGFTRLPLEPMLLKPLADGLVIDFQEGPGQQAAGVEWGRVAAAGETP